MKLATFAHAGTVGTGVVEGETVHPLAGSPSMLTVVEGGLPVALERGRVALESGGIALHDVSLLPPIQPPSFRDFVAFEEHVAGVRRAIEGATDVPEAWYRAPAFYFSNPHAFVGAGDEVPIPDGSVDFDFELEVAAVVGRGGSDLTPSEGRDAIFGYTILNDWSARDLQRPEMQVGLGPAKGKDFASAIGPWIVTADELDARHDDEGFLDLWCEASVNGVAIGRDLLSNMGWTFGALLAYASHHTRLVPGDLLGSGTVGNGGCLAELWGRNGVQDPPPLRAGDTVSLVVEGIGTLSNPVVAGTTATPTMPSPRRRDAAKARLARSESDAWGRVEE